MLHPMLSVATAMPKFKHKYLALVLCSTTLYSGLARADDAALQRQIEAQQRTMNSQVNQINVLQQDIAELRGELEQLRYLLRRQGNQGYDSAQNYQAPPASAAVAPVPSAPAPAVPASSGSSAVANNGSIQSVKEAGPVTPLGNDNLVGYRNQQANTIPVANPTPAPAPVPKPPAGPALKGVDATAQKAYNTAYGFVQTNNLKEAQNAFRNYVDMYPDNALTPNAWYWLGQVQYSQAQYNDARLSFLNVARYEGSQKRPDALYKLGMISKFLGDPNKAARYYQLVIQTYPQDAAASLANRELQRLQG